MGQFLGFANYFRRFIDQYSSISAPLEETTGKYSHFQWTAARQESFDSIKSALVNAPVLQLPDIEKPFRVETDASDFVLAGVLLQPEILDSDSCWHPVAYMSRKSVLC